MLLSALADQLIGHRVYPGYRLQKPQVNKGDYNLYREQKKIGGYYYLPQAE